MMKVVIDFGGAIFQESVIKNKKPKLMTRVAACKLAALITKAVRRITVSFVALMEVCGRVRR